MPLPNTVAAELQYRIERDVNHFQGKMPERYAIAWRAYLAGLLEWNVIELPVYDALTKLVPVVADDPAPQILRGRNDAE